MSGMLRPLAAAVIVLSTATQTHGQTEATCTAYREADAIFGANPAVRDSRLLLSILPDIDTAGRLSPRQRALGRAINALITSPSYRKAAERRRRAYVAAYKGPVSEDEHLMGQLLIADRKSCKDRFGD